METRGWIGGSDPDISGIQDGNTLSSQVAIKERKPAILARVARHEGERAIVGIVFPNHATKLHLSLIITRKNIRGCGLRSPCMFEQKRL